jgi:hypothetical protein
MRTRTLPQADWPVMLFALIILAALAVSAPATYNLVALYHNDGTTIGVVASVALLVILELGAVASKLATLWVRSGGRILDGFTVAALVINTLSNFVHGGLIAADRGLHWLAAWGGALIYAALLPALVYLMLHLLVERVRTLRGLERTVGEQVAELLQPVALATETAAQAQRMLAALTPTLALPEPQATSYPREAERPQPVLVPQIACPQCGAEASRRQLTHAPQHSGWRCSCGHKVPLVTIEVPGAR